MDHFRKKFTEEAAEHINELEKLLLDLENSPDDKELIEKVFRVMHSLKGGGAMFGFEKISEFTHHMETIYDMVRSNQLKISRDLLDVTLASVDHLTSLLANEDDFSPSIKETHNKLTDKITSMIGVSHINETGKQLKNASISNTIHNSTYYIHFVPTEKIFDNGTNPLFLIDELFTLGNCFVIAQSRNIPDINLINPVLCYTYWDIVISTNEEINSLSDVFIFVEDECDLEIHKVSEQDLLAIESFVGELQQLKIKGAEISLKDVKLMAAKFEAFVPSELGVVSSSNLRAIKNHTISSIRVSSDKLDLLMNLVSEMVTTQARLSLHAEMSGTAELVSIAENVQKLSRQLRDTAFSIVLIPLETMMTRFQRLIRDLSRELGKEAQFISEGSDTELDKTIIENLTDPLMHILRNSMDHGIELPHIREKAGKPRTGKILLKAFYSGANVVIEISDDGAGIDPMAIREKGIQKGIINPDVTLTNKEILDLIFLPGFSTAKTVTDVSGRGVGMDVVKRKIADIRGEVEVDSQLGKGTSLTIKLPITLSIIDGLLVKIDTTHYVIPLSAVHKIYAAPHKKLYNIFNNVVVLDDQQFSFFYLRSEFDMEEGNQPQEEVVVVRFEDKLVGLVVDEAIGEYQAVLKPLGKHYKQQETISGATILGDGTVALVLDTNKSIKLFIKNNSKTNQEAL